MKNKFIRDHVFMTETKDSEHNESMNSIAEQSGGENTGKKVKQRRTAREKARYHIRNVLRTGVSRKFASAHGKIASLGTCRTYEDSISTVFKTIELGGIEKPKKIDLKFANQYLEYRSSRVSQKTLDVDRLALSKIFGIDLAYQFSKLKTKLVSKAYTAEQVELILDGSSPTLFVAVQLCFLCGLRAHELLTILPIEERSISLNRDWWPEQFNGIPDGEIYTVVGKGGLIRPVKVPTKLLQELEFLRLPNAKSVRDRKIFYHANYDLIGGQNLSQQFSMKSKEVLGWSAGLHGLRHSYAQKRMRTLMALGYPFDICLAIVSREMGHYRPDITKTYLR